MKTGSFILTLFLLLSGCQTAPPPITPSATSLPATETPAPTQSATLSPSASPTTTITPTPQPRLQPQNYGIELEDFPPNYNPLTALQVSDPSQLQIPAALVSISNIPITARPQAGISFASWVFELYIGEATTRFLNVFYGEYPRRVVQSSSNCPVNGEIFQPDENWVGKRVWLDENENGIQEDWELGVSGICVHLYADGERIADTSTNLNGYYAFNLPDPNAKYFIEFESTADFKITLQNIGNEDRDSDADPLSGRTSLFDINSADAPQDLGLIPLKNFVPTPTPIVTGTPAAWYLPTEDYVGPIRSGRLSYAHINNFFPQSCLIFAGASPDIMANLDACALVHGVDSTTPNSALLTVEEMRRFASENGTMPNYSGNLFGGISANITREAGTYLSVFYHKFSQSYWLYDPLSQSYLRFTDEADGSGVFHPATDRLTGRQQAFENVVVLLATHDIFRSNQLDIDLRAGKAGFAYLFRDGEMMTVRWSTGNRVWEKKNGLLRPLHFVDIDGNPISLHPGKTWVHLMTPATYPENLGDGQWRVKFVQPTGANP